MSSNTTINTKSAMGSWVSWLLKLRNCAHEPRWAGNVSGGPGSIPRRFWRTGVLHSGSVKCWCRSAITLTEHCTSGSVAGGAWRKIFFHKFESLWRHTSLLNLRATLRGMLINRFCYMRSFDCMRYSMNRGVSFLRLCSLSSPEASAEHPNKNNTMEK